MTKGKRKPGPRREAAALVIENVQKYQTLENIPRLFARLPDGEEIDPGRVDAYETHNRPWGGVVITLTIPTVEIRGAKG